VADEAAQNSLINPVLAAKIKDIKGAKNSEAKVKTWLNKKQIEINEKSIRVLWKLFLILQIDAYRPIDLQSVYIFSELCFLNSMFSSG